MGKILVLIPLVNGFGRSGGYRVISKITDGLQKSGKFDVHIITPSEKAKPYYHTSAKIHAINSTGVSKLSVMFSMIMAARRFKPDVLVLTSNITAYIGLFVAVKRKKIYYIQANEVNFYKGFFRKLLAGVTYFFPFEKVINNKSLLLVGGGQYDVIPPGIDTELFYSKKCSSRISNIGLIGREEPHKGTIETIIAISDFICRNKLEDDVCVNIGIYLPDEAKDVLVNSGVSFRHVKIESEDELSSFYRMNELFVAIGKVEYGAFHYPCAESMACCDLVISCYSPLTERNTVFKMQSFDIKDLKNKLNLAFSIKSHDIEKEKHENNSVLDEFSWVKIIKMFEELIMR
ncbi:glycosyltransferase family 4 protein [Aeromonas caviae]|uniref:glycosyltransferase family 4 protein n=1 Tax=Aeromonas caviae TaxID=648 RepID=UPI0011658775|nr:glycosyltransferase family 4 protein [Aeromonas caviae]QDO76390.1 glycosyltransferase family 4 protein [Aeromonas caviae]